MHGADLLPLGVASFGHLGGVHLQNHSDIAAYCDAIERGDLEAAVAEGATHLRVGSAILGSRESHR